MTSDSHSSSGGADGIDLSIYTFIVWVIVFKIISLQNENMNVICKDRSDLIETSLVLFEMGL